MATAIVNNVRPLHWVLKIADRKATVAFFRQVLGMRTLRHEEFEKGCEATCNGPYDGKWSKTIIGYGTEDNHFVLELTYNYDVLSYDFRNDFRGITIDSRTVAERVKNSGYKFETVQQNKENSFLKVISPDGYPFYVLANSTEDTATSDPVRKISLTVSNVDHSVEFWSKQLGFKINEKSTSRVSLCCGDDKKGIILELVATDNGKPVDHGTAFGRIAFSCPKKFLEPIETSVKSNLSKGKVITPFISLDTPGKATVQVVIVADPDGYEVCFVGDEAFRQLSKVDDSADNLLDQAINNDKSVEWFNKKGLTKQPAGGK